VGARRKIDGMTGTPPAIDRSQIRRKISSAILEHPDMSFSWKRTTNACKIKHNS
jgi:hypothetical protein